MIVGVHGTSRDNIQSIVNSGFTPGPGQYHWLGYGVYAFAIHSESIDAIQAAFVDAKSFAEQKFPATDIGYIALEIDDAQLIDLQHFKIYPLLKKFCDVLAARSQRIGLQVESNESWARSYSHFTIDAFRVAIEALSPNSIDAIETQFNGPIVSPVEERRSPEICIKRDRAIIRVHEVNSPHEVLKLANRREWSPCNALIKAAKAAATFVRDIDDANFIDFVCTVAEGANWGWHKRSRFPNSKRISLVFGRSNAWADEVVRHWGSTTVFNTDSLNGLCGPECYRKIDQLVSESDGIIAVADFHDSNFSSIVVRARDLGRPLLILTTRPEDLPCETRSARNVTILKLKPIKNCSAQVISALRGFSGSNWIEESTQSRLRLMLAARNCDRETNASKIDHIGNVRKIAAQHEKAQSFLDLPHTSNDGNFIRNLPEDPEQAAAELRKRLKISKPLITKHEIIRALGSPTIRTADITASGYLIGEKLLGQQHVIVLREKDSLVRQKFTLAHEVAHAILDAAKWDIPEDEERWCDEFASALLMPASFVDEHEKHNIGLADWLDILEYFQVSAAAAMHRVWKIKRILLIFPKAIATERFPHSSLVRELIEIAKRATFRDLVGELHGVRYAIRLSKNGFMIVADLSEIDCS